MKTDNPIYAPFWKRRISLPVMFAPVLTWILVCSFSIAGAEITGKESPDSSGKKVPAESLRKKAPGTSATPAAKKKISGKKKAAPGNSSAKAPGKALKKGKPGTTAAPAANKKSVNKNPGDDGKAGRKLEKKRAEMIGKTIDYGIQKDRLLALAKILDIRDRDIKKGLLKKSTEVLKSETDLEVTIKIITIIGECDYTEAVPVIMKKLDNRTEDVRVSAVYALKKMKTRSSKQKLAAILKSLDLSRDSTLTEALIDTLGEFRATELTEFAVKSIKDVKTTRSIREWMVLFLGKTGDAGSAEFLLKLYLDEDENVTIRSYAVNSLAKIGAKSTTGEMRRIVEKIDSYPVKKKRRYYSLYMYSVAAMARLGDSEALPRLMNSMRSNSSNVRLKAVKLIREMKDKRTIDILKYKMNYDPSDKVRSAAKKALKELGVPVEKEKVSPPEEPKK